MRSRIDKNRARAIVSDDKQLKKLLANRLKESLQKKQRSPLLSATSIWSTLSAQLEVVVGATIYQSIFSEVYPLVLADQILILKTTSTQKAQWFNYYYKDVIDALLTCQDKQLSCVFLSTDKTQRTGLPLTSTNAPRSQ